MPLPKEVWNRILNSPLPKVRSRARPVRGRMNKLETSYAAYLETLRLGGEITGWSFESIKLRLADRTWYEPDFLVIAADLELQIHEVKGHWEDDARVKVKVAAEQFPFRFFGIRRLAKTKQWSREEF